MIVPQTEVIITANGAELGRFTVTPGEYVIGREGDIPVEAELVSRRHALLTVNYGDWLIEDFRSTNGTQLNGQRVSGATRVWPSQKIQLGAATIELHRVQTQPADGQSLSPQAASVRRYLPPEFLRGNKYAIERPIAQGGMGAILAAQEAGLRRPVAMKVMLESGGESDLVRFIEEAQITGQLQHPNIVPVYELGVDEHDQVFYTMKLVEGITLKKVLELLRAQIPATVEKYPLNTLLTIFLKVCDALAYAHAKRVIHRDLKPENLMLGSFGEVLVMDWGLAKVLRDAGTPARDSAPAAKDAASIRAAPRLRGVVLSSHDAGAASTLAGTIMGTPHFMSPEQANGKIDLLDARSDIFSLGAILYQILTLDLPFQGRTIEEVLAKVRRCQPLPPAQAALARATLDKAKTKPEVPAALAAVAMKALSLRPEDRYQSVTDLQREIEAYQGGFATGAEKAGAWKQFTLFIRRNKAASIGVAAVLLIGGTLGTKAVVEGRRAKLALADLRGTAPTFAAQAGALLEGNKFDEALEKIDFAIKLDPANADYHSFRANTLQAMTRLPEAIAAYRSVLALRGGDAAVKANLDLCEKLLAENGGSTALTLPLKSKLLDAILAQKRQADAVPLSQELKRDSDTAETLIKSRLKSIMAQPKWKPDKLKRLPDGTFSLNLYEHKVPDLGILTGLPISSLDLTGFNGVDLSPLRQVPLKELVLNFATDMKLDGLRGMALRSLSIQQSQISDLSPLAKMPLEALYLKENGITDLSPLQGMPLKHLMLYRSKVSNLRPLRGAPLEWLNCFESKVESFDGLQGSPLVELYAPTCLELRDISALRGLPLKRLNIASCPRITDLTPLAGCTALETLLVPGHISDIAFLQKLPGLKRMSNQSYNSAFGRGWEGVTPAADFWKKNGERLAKQVPMEKQIEKFRQRLIAEGNAPEKVPRWAFDADGGLSIYLDAWLKCSDLSELRGVAVTTLNIHAGTVRDLSPLAGAPLSSVAIHYPCSVTDLSPLRGAPIEGLTVQQTSVRDISVLRGMPLRRVFLTSSPIVDISPLAEIPTLEQVQVPHEAKNIETLRGHPKIGFISYWIDQTNFRPSRTAAEFWKEFDAKKGAAPK